MTVAQPLVETGRGPRRIERAGESPEAASMAPGALAPEAIESFELGPELAGILRRRAGALSGTQVDLDIDPPTLRIGIAGADLLRRALSLMLSALAARPALERLEVKARGCSSGGGAARLQVSARALVNLEADGGDRFRTVERRLLERAGAIVRFRHGLLVSDDRRAGELRASLEIDVVVVGPLAESGRLLGLVPRTVAVVSADEARSRGWSRDLSSGGHAVERFGALGELLRRCDPLASRSPAPDWVILDDGLMSCNGATLEALRSALELSGVASDRIVVAASGFERRSFVPPRNGDWVRLEAPVVASELLALVARDRPSRGDVRIAPGMEAATGAVCESNAVSSILSGQHRIDLPA